MEVKTGLLIWWILMMIQAMTCRPTFGPMCTHRIEYQKKKMEDLLNAFLSANGNETRPWQEPMSELNLKNLSSEEKMQKAQCGLNFMQKALELIYQHQRQLHDSKHSIFKEIINTKSRLEDTKHCVIGKCTNMTEPDCQHTGIYMKKLWDRTVLETSVNFLDELVNIAHHPSSKKHA